jgi:hypothetical protein
MFFFVAGPMGIGMGGAPGIRLRDPSEMRGTALFITGILVCATLLSNSFPYLVPLVTGLIHLFPDQLASARDSVERNKAALFLLGVIFLWLMLDPQELGFWPWAWGEESDDDYLDRMHRRNRQQSDDLRRRQHHHQQQQQQRHQREYSEMHRRSSSPGGVDGFDGSWGGSVVVDFMFSMFLIFTTFLLPQIWSFLNSWVLRMLSEERRATWREWTSFMRPASPPPGSVPASRQAISKLENVVLEERHLLVENSPGGIICPVCLEKMKLGECVKRLPCKHFFHGSCVLPWLEKHNSCPTCRYELETNDPVYEFSRRERQSQQARSSPTSRPATVSPTARPPQQDQPQEQPPPPPPPQRQRPQPPSSPNSLEEYNRLMALTVVELKSRARQLNVNVVGCVEKHELVERIVARARTPVL